MSKLLRINTRTKEYAFEDVGQYAGLGGRALTSKLVLQEVPPSCHPLSAENKLVFATGMLTGTKAASSGRCSVGAKSPLTGGIKESNSGGQFAQKMARLDILGIVFEDKPAPDAPFMGVKITAAGVELFDASDLAGLGTYAAAEKLLDKAGKKAAAVVIGPAGEKCLKAASIQFTDTEGRPARAAGRGGLGAVMGAKKVKALVIDDAGAPKMTYADEEAFSKANKRWVEILKNHPVTGQGLPGYGTAILVNIINEAGALPTKNWRTGRFEFAPQISGEKMTELMNARGGKAKEGCHAGCVIQCSQTFVDKDGTYLSSGLEYETVWALGANCLIKDIDDIARMDHVCDDMGVDTIEMGNAIGVAMDGGLIPWGDSKAAIELLKKIGSNDPLGRIIGSGTAYTAEAYGVDRVPVVKNQAMPAYDPRAVKGVGVTYATTPMGADHTAGYAVCQNILNCGGSVAPLGREGQIETSKNLQIATAAVDSTGLCLFVAFAVLDTADALQCVCDMINARFGSSITIDDVVKLGVSVLKDEYTFNEAAGFSTKDDQLPHFMAIERLPPHNVIWDFSAQELQGAKA